MRNLPIHMNIIDENIFFRRSLAALIDKKQWMCLQKQYHLTNRELQVVQFVCRGYNNNEIAKTLKIKPGTVKTHLRNIYRRVRVNSKIRLFLRFITFGKRLHVPSRSAPFKIPIVDVDKKGEDNPAVRDPSKNNPM